jgi:hypothetical protein
VVVVVFYRFLLVLDRFFCVNFFCCNYVRFFV